MNDSAFIRELHVFGTLSKHYQSATNVQHRGFGTKLLQKAEEISKSYNVKSIHIISGVQ